MLSKVLKGGDARQVRAMTFAAAFAPAQQPRPAFPQGDVGDSEEQVALLQKIRLLEAGLHSGQQEAFEDGRRQGEREAQAALAPVLGRMTNAIAELIGMRPELRRRAEKDAVELSMKIAQRVLHRELSIDSNALNALARVVFDRLARAETWELTVHPQFANAIHGALPAGSADRVRIEADPSCSPGTFVVRYSDGVIDASVDSQLAEINRGLTDRLIPA
jgi:flagellar assembly protein FliH